MLIRERIALKVLEEAGGKLPKTTFVKLVFLLRMETAVKQYSSFYDFVPYNFGPFSFALYRDLDRLESYGYVSRGEDHIALNKKLLDETQQQTTKLARYMQLAVVEIVERYGQMQLSPLIKDVYDRYRWYALNSERSERKLFPTPARPKAAAAIYTIGYEGKTVDAFFNYLLEKGIATIIDIRANPISRKYGFAGSRMKKIGQSIGLNYQHFPSLGISSDKRANLGATSSYAQLLNQYEKHSLPQQKKEVSEVGQYMFSIPSVLVCVEKDVNCCHRSTLSLAIAKETGMEVIHL